MKTQLKWAFWGLLIVVLGLSLAPTDQPLPSTGWDKSNHLLAFSTLALVGLLAYPERPRPMLVGLIAYGGVIEILQYFTGYRFAEWGDLLADAIGVGGGYGIWLYARRFVNNRSTLPRPSGPDEAVRP